MNITLHYYAMLREKAGISTETVETDATTPLALFEELSERHHFDLDPTRIGIAINNEMTAWETAISDGDQITFIPPVAGG